MMGSHTSSEKEYTTFSGKREYAVIEHEIIPIDEDTTSFAELYENKQQFSIYNFVSYCSQRVEALLALSNEKLIRIIRIFTEIKDEYLNFSMMISPPRRRVFNSLESSSETSNVRSPKQYFKYRDESMCVNQELKWIGNAITLFKQLKDRINAMDDAGKIWDDITMIMFLALERKPPLEKRAEFLKKEIDRYENDFKKIREMINPPPLPP